MAASTGGSGVGQCSLRLCHHLDGCNLTFSSAWSIYIRQLQLGGGGHSPLCLGREDEYVSNSECKYRGAGGSGQISKPALPGTLLF